MTTEEKMIWSNARRIIAMMANVHSGRNWLKMKFIGEAMRSALLSVSHYQAVAPVALVAKPKPASIRFLDSSPKTLFNGGRSCETDRSHDLNLRFRFGFWLGSFSVRRTVRAICILALLTFATGTTFAQAPTPTPTSTPVPSDDQGELISQQQMLAELRFLRKENAGLKDEIAADKGTIATQSRMIEIEKERGDFFKVAAEKGIKVGDNCGIISEKYDRMIATYDAEVKRLQSENDKLRESRKWRSVISGVGGIGLGYYAGQRGCKP